MEGRVPAELEEVFGAEVLDHTLVLLTCGDYLMGRTVEVIEMTPDFCGVLRYTFQILFILLFLKFCIHFGDINSEKVEEKCSFWSIKACCWVRALSENNIAPLLATFFMFNFKQG